MSGILGAVATLPDESVLRDKVREVLSRPTFSAERSTTETPWWIEMFIKVIVWLAGFLKWFLFDFTEGWPMVLRVLITLVMLVLLVAVLVHGFNVLLRALSGDRRPEHAAAVTQSALMPAREWERLADAAAARGEWIAAVRHLFRACLARLEDRERRPFRRGTTNRGHLRRYRNTPFSEALEVLVVTIERKWYGDEVCDAQDYQACRQAHSRVTASVIGGKPC